METKNTTVVEIEGKKYTVDLTKAQSLGLLEPVVPPRKIIAGDVFVDRKHHGKTNSFLVVQVVYGDSDTARYQLLGNFGCACNSNPFFHTTHTLEEINKYIIQHDMVFSENISYGVQRLVRNCK